MSKHFQQLLHSIIGHSIKHKTMTGIKKKDDRQALKMY